MVGQSDNESSSLYGPACSRDDTIGSEDVRREQRPTKRRWDDVAYLTRSPAHDEDGVVRSEAKLTWYHLRRFAVGVSLTSFSLGGLLISGVARLITGVIQAGSVHVGNT